MWPRGSTVGGPAFRCRAQPVEFQRSIDLLIVLGYLVAVTVYGVVAGRRTAATPEGYFLGGRQLGWFTIGASIFATNISITQFMSTSGLAHRAGLASVNNDLIGGLLLGVSAIFFVPVYVRSRLLTLPQFLERRYNPACRHFFGWIYVAQAVLHQPSGYYVGGLGVLGLLGFPLEYLPVACLAIGVLMGVYTILGGLTSVVKVDVVQTVMLVTGGLILSVCAVQRAGGWEHLCTEYKSTHFELLPPRGSALPWTALPGIALHSCFFAFCSIPILQRVLSARSEHDARCGMVFAGWLKLLAIPLFALPGIAAVKLYPGALGDATYAMLVRDVLPASLSGLVMAAMLAALMSSADSNVNAIASVVALDIYPTVVRHPTEQDALRVGKVAGALILAFAVVVAPYYQHLGAIYLFILRLGGFLFLPVGVCFIFGRFSRRVNAHGAMACLGAGGAVGLGYVLLSTLPALAPWRPEWVAALHFYEVLPFFFLLCTGILFGVSAVTPPPDAEQLEILSLKESAGAGPAAARPIWQSFQLWMALLCAALGLIYLAF